MRTANSAARRPAGAKKGRIDRSPGKINPSPFSLFQGGDQFVAEVGGRDRALLHERDVELLGGKYVAQLLLCAFAQLEDQVAPQPIGDRLRRPLRVADDLPPGF